jgi:hypothetical protein
MNKEEVVELIKQYSNETTFLSFTKHDHPAFIKLKAAGSEIIPHLLDRLADAWKFKTPGQIDRDNDPWLLICLLGELTDGACTEDFPENNAGKIDELMKHIIAWGITRP